MAKPATLQIKLVSTADTGYFYVTKKTRAQSLKSWKFGNMIRRRASTFCSAKPRSNRHRCNTANDRPCY